MAADAASLPSLYSDLAGWYDLLIPLAAVREESLLYRQLLVDACTGPARTLLDLGSGAGQTAHHLKAGLAVTLVDLAPEMVAAGRVLNPECEHHVGDMRSIRLAKHFDLVLLNDSIGYMASLEDLELAIETAFLHCRPGGAALFCPDHVKEAFVPETHWVGGEDGERTLRCLAWSHQLPGEESVFVIDMAYLLQRGSVLESTYERHRMGLFSRARWLEAIAARGFRVHRITVEVGAHREVSRDAFLATRP